MKLHIAVAQMGPIARSDTRSQAVARLCDMLEDAAKAGVEEGIHMIGGSCIVAPTGEIAVQALSEDDEVINYVCDMSLADGYRGNIFHFERHRRPEHYRAIVDRVGSSRSPL